MKIINNITQFTPFEEVEVGSVFRWADAIFMRTDDNNTEWGLMNAVNLESGLAVHFCCNDEVFLLPNAHIVIE